MNKAKLIEALNMTIESLNMVLDALGDEVADNNTEAAEPSKPAKTAKTAKKTATKPVKPEKEDEEETASSGDVSVDEIKAMGYNDLKKYAQSIGIKAVGTRDQIVAKVIDALENGATAEENEKESGEEKENSKVVPIGKKSSKGGLKKKAEAEPEEEEDEIAKAVREEADGMDITEIAELLQSVGIKASGNKEKLVNLLIGAVKDGKLDFSEGDSGEESGEESGEDETESGEAVDFHEYHEDYDPHGLNDPSNMTKKRAKAVSKMIDEEVEKIENGDTSEKDIKDFLTTVLTEGETDDYGIDSMDETELVFLYLEVMKSFIDDDGDSHEPSDPYVINDDNICCGHPLSYDDESGLYICESCGETYEE